MGFSDYYRGSPRALAVEEAAFFMEAASIIL